MAETIRKVDLYSIDIPNKPGEAAKVLGAFRDAEVSILAAWGYPTKGKKARLDLIAADRAIFTKAAKKADIDLGSRQTAFLIEGEDQTGALAGVLAKLGDAGINVLAAQAVTGGAGRYAGVISVDSDDVKKATKLLGA